MRQFVTYLLIISSFTAALLTIWQYKVKAALHSLINAIAFSLVGVSGLFYIYHHPAISFFLLAISLPTIGINGIYHKRYIEGRMMFIFYCGYIALGGGFATLAIPALFSGI